MPVENEMSPSSRPLWAKSRVRRVRMCFAGSSLRRQTLGVAGIVLVLMCSLSAVKADTVFFDDFESYPVSNPSDFSATGNWAYNGFAGDANTDRIFFSAPNYGGTTLWISAPGNVGAGLNGTGIPVVANTDYTLSAALVMETSNGARTGFAEVDLLVGNDFGSASSLLGVPATFGVRGDGGIAGSIDDSYDDQRSELAFNTGAINPGDQLFVTITYSGPDNNPGFFGVDEVRLFEENGLEDEPQVVVNRDTGNITLNNFTGDALNILGYSVVSSAGSLSQANWNRVADLYDASGDGSIDTNNNWTVLTAPGNSGDLSEAELEGGDGGTISGGGLAGQSVDLGNVWIRSPFEDVTAELLLAGSGLQQAVTVVYEGNGGEGFLTGDLAGPLGTAGPDGAINLDDWIAFKTNYGSSLEGMGQAERYLHSDLNGDGTHSLEDIGAFETAYDAANGLGAFAAMVASASVPEPTTATLVGILLFGALAGCRRRLPDGKVLSALAVGIMTICGVNSIAQAVPLNQANSLDFAFRYEMDALLGSLDLDSNGTNDWFDGVAGNLVQPNVSGGLGSSNQLADPAEILWRTDYGGSLTRAAVGSEFTIEISVQVLAGTQEGGDVGGFGIAMQQPGQGQSIRLNVDEDNVSFNGSGADLISTASNTDGQHTFRIAYENGGANGGTDDAYWVWRDDVLLNATPNTPFVGSNGSFNNNGSWFIGDFTGSLSGDWIVDYIRVADGAFSPIGGATSGPLTLQVDPVTGNAMIVNTFQTPIEISSYSIESGDGALSSAAWNSLESDPSFGDGVPDNGIGWEVVGNTSSQLAEANLLGSSTFNQSDSVDLGNIFLTGDAPAGDYNADGSVDALDYNVWRENLGTANILPNDPTPGVDASDYDTWKTNFGSTGGGTSALPSDDLTFRFRLADGTILEGAVVELAVGASSATSVPEPSGLVLLMVACIGGLCARSRNSAFGVPVGTLAFGLAFVFQTIPSYAVVTYDRLYHFGDPGTAETSLGAVIGEGNSLGYNDGGFLRSADEEGTIGISFTDLNNTGGTYTSASSRPGAGAGDFAARFNGSSDFLVTNRSLNAPSQFWDNAGDVDNFFPNSDFPFNYEGIFSRGISLWAQPDASTLNAGNRQDLVLDTAEHGIFITSTGNWGLQFDAAGIDSGVAVSDTLDANGWAHVMELSGFGDPLGGGSAFAGALLVNGTAVAARGTFYDPSAAAMSVGANLDGTDNFYHGAIDDLGVFFWGDNRDQLGEDGIAGGSNSSGGLNADGMNWGALELAESNEWIKLELQSLGVTDPGDVNLDTVINDDDVNLLVDNWLEAFTVSGVQIGDWRSRQQGDLNYDGIVDLADVFILHGSLQSAGLGGFDFRLLASREVPEPMSAWLGLLGAMTCGMIGRRAVRVG